MKTSEYIDFRQWLSDVSGKWQLRARKIDLAAAGIAEIAMKLANDFLYVNVRQFHQVLTCIEEAAAAGELPHKAAIRIAQYVNTCR